MKTKTMKPKMLILLALMTLTLAFQGCSKETQTSDSSSNASDTKEALLNYSQEEETGYTTITNSSPAEELSESEEAALVKMREEEMLAHDVYQALSQLYTRPVFKNITKSEAIHTEVIRLLLVKYQVPDPAANHVAGVFTNPDLQLLYNNLINSGSQSLLNGFITGAGIEDLDIYDLQQELQVIDNHDIIVVFNNLINGSKNHLRAFFANILAVGGSYTPQYISQVEFNAIINQ